MSMPSTASRLETIREKVHAQQRLSAAEGELLFAPEVDLHIVGELADLVRRRKNGRLAYYNTNAHLNPTNVCVYRCPLCAYRRRSGRSPRVCAGPRRDPRPGPRGGRARRTELHIVGGLHPAKDFSWYSGILSGLHAECPRLHLKAWTAVEIAWFAARSGQTVRAVLQQLIEAGLGSLPGGGAEIFDAEIRRQISPRKPDAATWLDVHREAHALGLRTNATMLFGHLEDARASCRSPAAAPRCKTRPAASRPSFRWRFIRRTRSWPICAGVSGLVDLRVVAVSRLMLDNFDHVKAYWVSLGVGTAQIALAYGADDLDGTVRHEQIHHDAGATTPEVLVGRRIAGADRRGRLRAGGARFAVSPRATAGSAMGGRGAWGMLEWRKPFTGWRELASVFRRRKRLVVTHTSHEAGFFLPRRGV